MRILAASAACLAVVLTACGGSAQPDATTTRAAASDPCANRPAESVADYRAKSDTFESTPGFDTNLSKGQVLNDGDELQVIVSEADFSDGLGYQAYYLGNCSVHLYHSGNLYNQGEGRWTNTLQTGTGSDIADGTPAFIEIIRTRLIRSADGGMPKATTEVVGAYSVRINNPRD